LLGGGGGVFKQNKNSPPNVWGLVGGAPPGLGAPTWMLCFWGEKTPLLTPPNTDQDPLGDFRFFFLSLDVLLAESRGGRGGGGGTEGGGGGGGLCVWGGVWLSVGWGGVRGGAAGGGVWGGKKNFLSTPCGGGGGGGGGVGSVVGGGLVWTPPVPTKKFGLGFFFFFFGAKDQKINQPPQKKSFSAPPKGPQQSAPCAPVVPHPASGFRNVSIITNVRVPSPTPPPD